MTRGKKNKEASQSCSYKLLPRGYLDARNCNLPKDRLKAILVSHHDRISRLICSSDIERERYTKIAKAIADEYCRISKN